MKILLTGPTGFIGSAFGRLALARGHQVAGLAVPGEALPAGLEGAVAWLRGTLDAAPWREIAAFAPDVCVHAAWITTPGIFLESPENERFRDWSLAFVRQLLGLGVGHIVGVGTCVEYRIATERLNEESTPTGPTTTYARCKNELRLALEAEVRRSELGVRRSLCWARVFYPYGPGEHPSRLCSSLIAKLRRGEEIVLKTPDSTKDYIYIDDLAEALLTVVEKRFGGIINLGTGEGTTVRQMAGFLGQCLGRPELVRVASNPEPDPFPFVVADPARLKSLGWRQQVPLDEGLRRLVTANLRQWGNKKLNR
jgi:nucleoside-diphosphate-sugar epimerase